MTDDDKEIDLEIAGQKVRARGYRLIDLVWLPLVLGMAYCAMMAYQQEARAQVDKATLAKALKDSNDNSAQVARESNTAVVNALKEANENTVRALDRLTTEQRKSTDGIREIACLSDPALRNRPDAREICKRLGRSDRQ